MTDSRLREFRIKTGVVKRLAKEKMMYEQEAEQQKLRIQYLKDQGKGEYDIKKQGEVLQESYTMVAICQRRLVKAYEELKTLVDNECEVAETEEYKTAFSLLEDAKIHLPQP